MKAVYYNKNLYHEIVEGDALENLIKLAVASQQEMIDKWEYDAEPWTKEQVVAWLESGQDVETGESGYTKLMNIEKWDIIVARRDTVERGRLRVERARAEHARDINDYI